METKIFNTNIQLLTFGAVYNCNSYGAGDYNNGEECTTSTGGTGGSSGGSLVDTGVNIILPLVIGLVLIIGPAVYLIRKKMSKKQQSTNS